ncbi:MAG: DUF421 domain-containing protein [Isosphaeraceae bacterium]
MHVWTFFGLEPAWPVFPFAEAHSIGSSMFGLAVPVIEKVARPALVYVALVAGLRVFGKRELAQLNPFDFVVLISLSNTVQNAMIGPDDTVTGGLIGAFTLLTLNYLVVRFLFAHRRLDQIVVGKPATLIRHGRLVRKALARELITEPELMSILHRQGFTRLDEVETCQLEPGGTFAVTARQPRVFEQHHTEVLARIDGLLAELVALRDSVRAQAAPHAGTGPGTPG